MHCACWERTREIFTPGFSTFDVLQIHAGSLGMRFQIRFQRIFQLNMPDLPNASHTISAGPERKQAGAPINEAVF
jgi:hypothetical protein